MSVKPLKTGATYDDLRDVPDHYFAEMFDGELYASPRPALAHTRAASVLGELASLCLALERHDYLRSLRLAHGIRRSTSAAPMPLICMPMVTAKKNSTPRTVAMCGRRRVTMS
jgi:hypothetical protein